jgi:hypothetical protein
MERVAFSFGVDLASLSRGSMRAGVVFEISRDWSGIPCVRRRRRRQTPQQGAGRGQDGVAALGGLFVARIMMDDAGSKGSESRTPHTRSKTRYKIEREDERTNENNNIYSTQKECAAPRSTPQSKQRVCLNLRRPRYCFCWETLWSVKCFFNNPRLWRAGGRARQELLIVFAVRHKSHHAVLCTCQKRQREERRAACEFVCVRERAL